MISGTGFARRRRFAIYRTGSHTPWPVAKEDRELYTGMFGIDICRSVSSRATMKAYSRAGDKSTLRLKTLTYNCDYRQPGDEQRLHEEFDRQVIVRL